MIFNPAVTDSLLVLTRRKPFGELQVLNLFTGKDIRKRTVNEIRTGPILLESSLIFGTTNGLAAIDLLSLADKWSRAAEDMVDIAPVTDGKAVYYVSGETVRAVTGDGGELIWESEVGSAVISNLTIGNKLYMGLADSRVIALNPVSGKTIWERRLDLPVRGGMAETDDYVYTGCTDGRVYGLAAGDGTVRWTLATDGIVTAPPVVCGPAVLIGSHDRHLYSIDRFSGELLDRRRVEGPVTEAIVVTDNGIFATCSKNRLYCFEVSDGTKNQPERGQSQH